MSNDADKSSTATENAKEINVDNVLQNLGSLLRNTADREAFVKAVTKGGNSWETRHKGPYYKPKFALQFKLVVDEIIKDRKPRVYRYKDYAEFSRPRSLYLKLIQSRAYLLDKLDSEGYYKTWCSAIVFETKYNVGIIISIRSDLLDAPTADDLFHKPSIINSDDDVQWREKLDRYLTAEQKPEGVFEVTGLLLDENDQRELEVELSQLTNVSYRISQEKVIVVRES